MFFSFLKKQDINKGVAEFNITKDAVLLDVRTKEEYRSGHIPNSINIDASHINTITTIIADKNTPIFVHCLSGGRSSTAASALKSMGYTNVTNIGGINSYSGTIEKGA